MSGVEIRQRAASEGQRGGRRGDPPLYIGLAGALILSNYLRQYGSYSLHKISDPGEMSTY